jgi:dihydrofolate reductase
MRKLVVSEFVSLDGVMEDPGGDGGTEHGGWSFSFWSDEMARFKEEELASSDALLLGRVTYDGFAAAWPTQTEDEGFARMNEIAKYVVSSTLTEPAWNNSHVVTGDVAATVRALKEQPGADILVGGSASLVHALAGYGLIDEYRLAVCPVILGAGKRVFDAATYAGLELAAHETTSKGVLLLTYRVAAAA